MARSKKFKQNDNNLAIAYYRFSSHSQNEASIDQQRELAHAWADAHGLTIVKEYEDAAISGTKEDRPGFQLMLSEVAKIRPSTLIMWKTDRLGRDKYVLAMAKKEIRDAVMEYFVDKIYLYDDKLVATFFYSEDRTEISWGELGDLVIDPFVKGEAAEFDVFPFGSTKDNQRPYLKGVLIYRDVFLMYNK